MADKKAFLLSMPYELNQIIIEKSRQLSDKVKKRVSFNQVVNSTLEKILLKYTVEDLMNKEYLPNELKDNDPKSQTIYMQPETFNKLTQLSTEILFRTGKRVTVTAIINTFMREKLSKRKSKELV